MYIGWATNVNKKILDSTSISVGNGATVEDSLETGGQKKKRLVCANPPDKYSVTMEFECDTKGADGLTEYERFMAWYKWQHCYGVNPFIFPAILINSNRQNGNSQEEIENIQARILNGDPTAKMPDEEYYQITSAVDGSKSGHHQQVSMTWETYATGAFTIPDEVATVQAISAQNGYVDITLTATPATEPTTQTWTLKIDNVITPVTACVFDGDVTVRYYFTPFVSPGRYTASIGDFTSTFVVA